MPELPDVEVLRRYLQATALRQRIDEAEVEGDLLEDVSPARLREALRGRELTGATRHGKWLFAATDGHSWLALHFGMTGRLEYSKGDEGIPRHTRLLLRMTDGYHLAYDCQRKLGRVALTESPARFVERRGLGPDALELSYADFQAILEGRRSTLKGLLLDQEALAGIGNIYANEILYQAKLHPATPLRDLDDRERRRLHRQMRRVLEMSIDRQADAGRYPDTWLTPHRKAGASCRRCGAELVKSTVVGRSTYHCPGCQGDRPG